jgi:hypothetical protein
VKELRALTPEELERARERLLHPEPGGRIEAARKFGVDLSLLAEQLSLTLEERVRRMQDAIEVADSVCGAARRAIK